MTQFPELSRAVRAEYDRLAVAYDRRWDKYLRKTLDWTMAALDLHGAERVLDVPCGTGELIRRLLAKWPALSVVGVDMSRAMLQQATAKKFAAAVSFGQAQVENLPFANETFDAAVCANSLHYFADPGRALGEIHRVLKPGALLVLQDWCGDSWRSRLTEWWLRLTERPLRQTYRLAQCRTFLERADFIVEQCKSERLSLTWAMMCVSARRR